MPISCEKWHAHFEDEICMGNGVSAVDVKYTQMEMCGSDNSIVETPESKEEYKTLSVFQPFGTVV